MKKLVALLLLIGCILALVGCKEIYEPQESTEEEARVVMTLKHGNNTYSVKYELYRAFFLTYKSTVDGGDDGVWTGDSKDEYIEKIDGIIIDKILDIYSTFALAQSLGIDPYSTEVGKLINDYINISVDGGVIGGVTYLGYPGYTEYLESLWKKNLNYSVQTLLFRYAIVTDMIDEYFIGNLTEDDIDAGVLSLGALKYTEDDVRDFYFGDGCVRVLRTYISEEMDTDPEARAERAREAILDAAERGESAVRDEMINQGSTTTVPELENGFVIGKHNLSSFYYSDLTDAAMSLDVGEVSEVVSIHDGELLKYYIVYRAEKSEEHLEDNYAQIAYIYVRNTIGSRYNEVKEAMKGGVQYTDYLKSLDRSGISM